jgi:hypothetical protein
MNMTVVPTGIQTHTLHLVSSPLLALTQHYKCSVREWLSFDDNREGLASKLSPDTAILAVDASALI